MTRPIIAIATTEYSCYDPLSWSGIPYSMYRALRRRDDITTVPIGPIPHPPRVPEAIRKGYHLLRRRKYRWNVEPRIIDAWKGQMEQRLAGVEPDGVIAIGNNTVSAMPDHVRPTLFCDATFALNTDYYPTWTSLAPRSIRQGIAVDRRGFRHASRVVTTSGWAARDITETYGVDPARIVVTPMPAQHECTLSPDELAAVACRRLDGPMRLLWIGVEWKRKGGDVALATAAELDRRGIDVQIDLVGMDLADEVAGLPYARNHGFLDRRTSAEVLDGLFTSAFALLLPSRAENAGAVVAEAASYGAPSLTSDTGGLTTMVHERVNGSLVPRDGSAADYADVLEHWWRNHDEYLRLCATSRARFERELNWEVAGDVLLRAASGATVAPTDHGTTP